MESDISSKGSMRAAYLFQAVNIIVLILTVPLLLRFLNISEYVLWTIFNTFGAITLQFQAGIQPVAVREIAREYHGGTVRTLEDAVQRAKREYLKLVYFILGPFLIFGGIYLHFVASRKIGFYPDGEWFLYAAAFAFNYYFASSAAVLLGMENVRQQNSINTVTRLLYFAGVFFFLRAGYSILGICIAFAISMIASGWLNVREARKCLAAFRAVKGASIEPHAAIKGYSSASVGKYVLYSISAYLLYNGALLIAATIFPKNLVASYGLSLQTFAMLSAFAMVPIQVWLNKLVRAVAAQNYVEALRELSATVITANAIFTAGFIALAAFGNLLLLFLGSKVRFLSTFDLSLIWFAFLVELNILIFVNFLVTHRRYEFARIYLSIGLPGLLLGALLAILSHNLVLSLVVIPMVLQTYFTLPRIFRMVVAELAATPRDFLRGLWMFVVSLWPEPLKFFQ